MEKLELTRIVQRIVLEGRKPAKVVAEEVGKPYSTLLREVNPYDTSAKVGIETLIDIMRVTESVAPLEYLARLMGYELVPGKGNGKSVKTARIKGDQPATPAFS